MTKRFLNLALAAVTLSAAPVLIVPNAFSQAVSVNGGSIQGTITDPTGAIVPGANVTISSKDTGYKKQLTTDGSGFYSIGPLNPGNYTVSVTAPGFDTLNVQTVVRTGTATPGSFKLTLGASNTEINVTAGALQINTDQTAVSDVLTHQQIESLPINGRNFLDLAQVEPGVILQDGQSFDPTKAGYSAISVDGVSGRTTRILLDGQDITDETVGTTIINVPTGAINEFQMNRSNQDVSGEVTSTGQVLVSSGSGTNAFHGQLFYNFQDHRVGFARTTNGYDAPFQRNQFGGFVGGPIIKDKLFFFADVERIKQDQQSSATANPAFNAILAKYPTFPTPFRDTFSIGRLDYTGPFGGHYFARAYYEANAAAANYNFLYSVYNNRDNVPGIAGGADFAFGKFTHSFRVSYEKFHNLIADNTSGNTAIYNPNLGISFYDTADGFYAGPNYLAPQGTYQSDKQFRYDGTWTKGKNTFKYGYSLNRLLGGGFAEFFGVSPLVGFNSSTAFNPNVLGDPVNDYYAQFVQIGNGNSVFTEKPGFGLPGGGTEDWREGAYFADTAKVTPDFTVVAGLRWSVDTDRANQDLPTITCAGAVTAGLTTGCTGNSSLLAQLRPDLKGSVHQPYTNFGPQVGFVYSPGDHKTSIQAGIGIYYENDIFNNTSNARSGMLSASGPFFGATIICGGTNSIVAPGGTTITTATANGNTIPISQACSLPLGQAAPYFQNVKQQYQAATQAHNSAPNANFYGNLLSTAYSGAIYAGPYRTPYSLQYNFGVQREVAKGTILTANYIHSGTYKAPLNIDVNHNGSARNLNATAAANAIATTAAKYPGCGAVSGTVAQAQCAIANGAVLSDFAGNGLDSGATRFGGLPAQDNQILDASGNPTGAYYTPDTGAAFPGQNANFGTTQIILPAGQSGYDALQLVLKEQRDHPLPGVSNANFQASYSLSRVVNNTAGGQDQFFNNNAFDTYDPKLYMGRNPIDHTNEVSFGGSLTVKYGPQFGFTGHFFSAPPTTLQFANPGTPGQIFQTDVTGDGTTADILPGTEPGDYMHRIKPKDLNSFINNYNNTQAGTLTPAGQALVNAGIMTQAQLVTIGAVKPTIGLIPGSNAYANPAFRNFDLSANYPIRLSRIREGLRLTPGVAMYNVFNMANFGTLSGQLSGAGTLNGGTSYDIENGLRIQRGAGTFDQGAPRSTEFQLKLDF